MPIITLLTDFGCQDGFVGTMKGVILGINPRVCIVDISHGISPQNIREAAFVLRNAYRYFPEGTIHVVVVDPGVGGAREALIVETDRYRFVGPDNGVFAYIYRMERNIRVTAIKNAAYGLPERSRTFHGRDVFAPAAAHLSRGVQTAEFGPRMLEYHTGSVAEPGVKPDRIDGQIIHIDRFGNVITNIAEESLDRIAGAPPLQIAVAGRRFDRLCAAYADVATGDPLAIIGSAGLLEIAVNGGDAARTLGVSVGDAVTVTAKKIL